MRWTEVGNTLIGLGLVSELVAMSFASVDTDNQFVGDARLPTICHEYHEPNYHVPEFTDSMSSIDASASGTISASYTIIDYPLFKYRYQ